MFINQYVIAIAFKLINFIALIAIFSFLFKKYIKPDLLLSIERKKNKQEALFSEQTHLEKQQLHLDLLLKEDSVQCEQFRTKIDEWKKVIAVEHDHLQKKHDKTRAFIHKRFAHNALQREQSRVQSIVNNAVVAHVEKSLSLYFQDPEHNAEYVNAILHFMNESTS